MAKTLITLLEETNGSSSGGQSFLNNVPNAGSSVSMSDYEFTGLSFSPTSLNLTAGESGSFSVSRTGDNGLASNCDNYDLSYDQTTVSGDVIEEVDLIISGTTTIGSTMTAETLDQNSRTGTIDVNAQYSGSFNGILNSLTDLSVTISSGA